MAKHRPSLVRFYGCQPSFVQKDKALALGTGCSLLILVGSLLIQAGSFLYAVGPGT